MRKLVEKYSKTQLVIIITIISIAGTQIILRMYYTATATVMRSSEYIAGTIAPAIIASSMIYYLIGLLKKLNELEKSMRKIAYIDPVTKLKSRRALFESAEQLFQLAGRHKRNLGVLLLDIDNFKKINDTYGHIQGDTILLILGDIVNSLKRETDLAGRYGGDEILIFLPETDIDGCRNFAKKLLTQTSTKQIERVSHSIEFTVSIGISLLSKSTDFENLENFIDSADQALYHAKKSGRDCYHIS